MSGLVYLPGVATLSFESSACSGCGMCLVVCPHAVFASASGAVEVREPDRCIECGACARNCPTSAISVEPGVGCALAILKGWLTRASTSSCGSDSQVDQCGGRRAGGPGGQAPSAGGKPC